MNEYQGYTLTDITINSDMSLTGKIYYGAEFKQLISKSTIENFLDKFHQFVDDDIVKQSELTNCQNFTNELVELCKKYKVELSSYAALKVNDRNLCWMNRDFVHGIDGREIVNPIIVKCT